MYIFCSELYPRVLESILQTESSELILAHKEEILETLNIVANDAGMFIIYLLLEYKHLKMLLKH